MLAGLLALAACANPATIVSRTAGKQPPVGVGFDPVHLAKTDIDRVADAHRQEIFASLRLVAEKLYRRNPGEWRKSGAADVSAAADRLMDPAFAWRHPELNGRYATDAMQMAFREDYQGDRVLALVAGLGGMLHGAFNDKVEFFMIDDLDPQRLYNSARNVEIAVWRLSNARLADGSLVLASNEAGRAGQPQNLSFEREFGKIIGHCDMLARIVADKSSRTVVKAIQSLATAVFLPVVAIK